jgi:hypothetical protein
VVVSHDTKAAALHSYYDELLGPSSNMAWAFDVDELFSGGPMVDGAALIGPFSA